MTATRPPYQLELDLPMPGRGEAPRLDWQEVEAVTATAEPESPAPTEHLMEAICDPDNIEAALRAVVRNKGAPGVDGITVQQLPGILKARWSEIERSTAPGALPAATGASGENPEAGRRDTQPRHSNRDRSCDPAGGPAATSAAVGPDIQRAQLRLPAGSLRSPGSGAGASLRHRRLSVCCRYRLGQIF